MTTIHPRIQQENKHCLECIVKSWDVFGIDRPLPKMKITGDRTDRLDSNGFGTKYFKEGKEESVKSKLSQSEEAISDLIQVDTFSSVHASVDLARKKRVFKEKQLLLFLHQHQNRRVAIHSENHPPDRVKSPTTSFPK